MNEWMIASAAMALMFIAAGIVLLRQRNHMKTECELLQQEAERLRAENIEFRREICALERECDAEREYSEKLELEIDDLKAELERAAERTANAEARRTDAEKEIFASRMRLEQFQQQLDQAHLEQRTQEQLYQDIILDRDQTINRLQDKLHKRSKKKKKEILDRQITLEDILFDPQIK